MAGGAGGATSVQGGGRRVGIGGMRVRVGGVTVAGGGGGGSFGCSCSNLHAAIAAASAHGGGFGVAGRVAGLGTAIPSVAAVSERAGMRVLQNEAASTSEIDEIPGPILKTNSCWTSGNISARFHHGSPVYMVCDIGMGGPMSRPQDQDQNGAAWKPFLTIPSPWQCSMLAT